MEAGTERQAEVWPASRRVNFVRVFQFALGWITFRPADWSSFRAAYASPDRLGDTQPGATPTARLFLHNDLNVASEQDEKSHETIE